MLINSHWFYFYDSIMGIVWEQEILSDTGLKLNAPPPFFVLSLFLNFQVDSIYFDDIWGILIRLADCRGKNQKRVFSYFVI